MILQQFPKKQALQTHPTNQKTGVRWATPSFSTPFWNKMLNSCSPQSSVVPMSNNEEEDKTCCSFWISRQRYVTTPRNAGSSLPNQHSNRKAQSPFKLCSHKLEDSFTKINTPLAGRENITPFRMFFPFFFFCKVQMDYLNAKVTWIYTSWKSIFFLIYIYICTYMTVTDTEATGYIHSFPTC